MSRIVRILWIVLFAASFIAAPALAAPGAPAGPVGNGTPLSCDETAFRNAVAAGSPVTFNCGGPKTIQLTSPEVITQTMVIDGGGVITLTGNLATRLFTVGLSGTLTLENITLYEGYSGAAEGGAILNNGSLTVLNSTIKNSLTDGSHTGGAIATGGPLLIQNSRLSNNNASSGGAIYALGSTARITLLDSVLTFNNSLDATNGVGGAIDLGQQASLTVTGGFINSNMAPISGGALYIDHNASAVFQAPGSDVPHVNYNSAQASGGAIANEAGRLSLLQADLEYNHVPTDTLSYGGALDNEGALTVYDTEFRSNYGRYGGAVFVGGSLTSATAGFTRTLFYANTAGQWGGGLYMNNNATVVTVVDSAFDYNQATAGGGLARTNAQLNVSKSSFTHNVAQYGGGMYVLADPKPTDAGYVEIRDSTISSNLATSQHSGGIENAALLDLRNVTIKDNHYGLWNENSAEGAVTRLQDSVLDNLGGANCDGDQAVSSSGYNLANDTSCHLTAFHDTQSVDAAPQLGPLTLDPVGITSYHVPLAGSPLIDSGGPGCAVTDQRHALRNGACDIGAVEYHGLLPVIYFPMLQR